jgi:hypothetical protein
MGLEQIGLNAVAAGVDDFLPRATKQRWSPRRILEHLTQTEAAEPAHRGLERQLRLSEFKKFKPILPCNIAETTLLALITGQGENGKDSRPWGTGDRPFKSPRPDQTSTSASFAIAS